MICKAYLHPGREKSALHSHPWVFSGAVNRIEGKPQNGEAIEVFNHLGQFLGQASWSKHSQIALRFWNFGSSPLVLNRHFFLQKLLTSLTKRKNQGEWDRKMEGRRLVNGEGDGLPGVIVDCYGPWLACQFLSAGAEYYKQILVDCMVELYSPQGIYERSDTDARKLEGLQPCQGMLWGANPPEAIEIREGLMHFALDVRKGHKTGHYLDQRLNRKCVQAHSKNRAVLNCFCYTGGFGLAAALGGATSVLQVDSSEYALEQARNNAINSGCADKMQYQNADVFSYLRKLRGTGERFDLIILDPPKLAENKQHLNKACRAYKDVNLQAFHLLRPGGQLFTFSCSGLMEETLFRKVVCDAAVDAGREAHVEEFLFQAPDHSMPLHFPEGLYLKGLRLSVGD